MIGKKKPHNQGLLIAITAFCLVLHGCTREQQDNVAQSPAADNQSVYEWKMITSWPKNPPALGTLPEDFAEIVEKMSNGRLLIRVYGAKCIYNHIVNRR